MARRALITGINHYDELSGANLAGAIPDARAVAKVLARHEDGSPNYECKLLLSSPANPVTKAVLRREMADLFRSANDRALFYFSGHGSITPTGGIIVTQDGDQDDLGMPMDELLMQANRAREREVVVILDCCMSGAMGNPAILQTGETFQKSQLDQNVTILAASRQNEVSMEVGGQGVFTSLLIDALEGGAADMQGKVTWPSVYAFIEAHSGHGNNVRYTRHIRPR